MPARSTASSARCCRTARPRSSSTSASATSRAAAGTGAARSRTSRARRSSRQARRRLPRPPAKPAEAPLPLLPGGEPSPGGLQKRIQLGKSLGPVRLEDLQIGLSGSASGDEPRADITAAVSLSAHIGPVFARVDHVGLRATLTPARPTSRRTTLASRTSTSAFSRRAPSASLSMRRPSRAAVSSSTTLTRSSTAACSNSRSRAWCR